MLRNFLGSVHTERHHQRCNNADGPDQFGVPPHFWRITPSVLKNLQAINRNHMPNDVAETSRMLSINWPLKSFW